MNIIANVVELLTANGIFTQLFLSLSSSKRTKWSSIKYYSSPCCHWVSGVLLLNTINVNEIWQNDTTTAASWFSQTCRLHQLSSSSAKHHLKYLNTRCLHFSDEDLKAALTWKHDKISINNNSVCYSSLNEMSWTLKTNTTIKKKLRFKKILQKNWKK